MSGPIAAPRPEQSMMTLIAFPVRSAGMNAVIMAAATDMSIAPLPLGILWRSPVQGSQEQCR